MSRSRSVEEHAGCGGRKLVRSMTFLAAFVMAPVGLVLAGPSGELDGSFGSAGRIRIGSQAELHWGFGRAIAEQPDGKLLLAGHEAWEGSFLIHRLNQDGSVDLSFGDSGMARVDFDVEDPSYLVHADDEATAIAIQPDGKIIVGGHVDSSYGTPEYVLIRQDIGLARLHPNGTLDTSFGSNGRVFIDLGGRRDYLSDVLLLPAGEIVIAGFSDALGTFDAVFARLDRHGTLDTTFGSDAGGVTIVESDGSDDRMQALVRQADGSLIACGTSSQSHSVNPDTFMSAVRVLSNGHVDAGFGAGGTALVAAGTPSSAAEDCLAFADGTVLLAGYSGRSGAEDMQLAWLGPNGALATAYGQGGLATVVRGGSESIQGITSLVDGSIAVIGLTGTLVEYSYPNGAGYIPMWFSPFPSKWPSEMLFAKLDRFSGQLDPTFGDNGITLVDFGTSGHRSWAYGRSIIATADGKLVAVGTTIGTDNYKTPAEESPAMAVARVDPAATGSAGVVGFIETYFEASAAAERAVATIRRTGGSSGAVMVDYFALPGTATAPADFSATSGTLVWNDGEMSARTIEIRLTAGRELKAGKAFSVVLESATVSLAASEFVVALSAAASPQSDDARRYIDLGGSGGGGAFGPEVWLLLVLGAWLARVRRKPGSRAAIVSRGGQSARKV